MLNLNETKKIGKEQVKGIKDGKWQTKKDQENLKNQYM